MSHRRKVEDNQRLLKLYQETSNWFGAGVYYSDRKERFIRYSARQISKSAQVRLALNAYPGDDVLVMRIGDKQSDKLQIPADYAGKICAVEKYCTLPELEMLLIISEGVVGEFEKVKSTTGPKDFAKEHIRLNRVRYNNSTKFLQITMVGTVPS